jgi:hypothetical protein
MRALFLNGSFPLIGRGLAEKTFRAICTPAGGHPYPGVDWQLPAAESAEIQTDPRPASELPETAVLPCLNSPPEPRRFVFDRPFLIYLQQRQAQQPYFVMRVENPEVLVPEAGTTREGGSGRGESTWLGARVRHCRAGERTHVPSVHFVVRPDREKEDPGLFISRRALAHGCAYSPQKPDASAFRLICAALWVRSS